MPDRSIRRQRPSPDDETAAAVAAARAGRAGEPGTGPALVPNEELLVVLRGIGATMFLTSERVILARDGFERRPRSGIQSFPLESIRHLRLELGSGTSGRIALWTGTDHEVVSMFFDARSLDRAESFLDVARPRIARLRRRGHAGRPVRPPSGPAGAGSTCTD